VPFFFVLPLWVLAVVTGIVMVCIQRLRRAGIYVDTVSTFATVISFVLSTAATAPKVTALSARPDVALTIDGGDTPDQARALSIRGRASVTIVDGVVEEYLAAARKSMDAEAAAQFEQNCRKMYDQMARIAITPRWVRYYDFGAGRMPRFLQELAERHRS